MINFSLDFSLNNSFILSSGKLSGLLKFKTGVSRPAESNNAIFLSLNFSKSGYFILKPSVLILVPEGSLIFDIFERRKDFPLLEFPITPILIIF